jgi:peptidoglycan/xylan/chitin deacetylase (PgdA/CDA1 family)
MGQSNMVGRDTSTLESQVDDPRMLSLNADGKWVVAREPIHPQVGRIAGGMGPGTAFAREMLKADPKITIGLVPCAVGGTGLNRWVKGADLYENAVARAKVAAQSGVLSGMLWHQGESDSDAEKNAQTYEERLTKMFQDFRADVGMPDLPIVVGQLGEFLPVDKHPYVETVRSVLRHIPEGVPHAGYADTKGLTDKGDQLHFNAASATELGKRFATAMQALAKSAASSTAPQAATAPSASIAPFAGNRAAAISYTFDDNLRDQYTLILPMLKETGIKGTFFVIAGKTAQTPEEGAARQKDPIVRGKWGGISWPELREIAAEGHEIGSHTWSHPNLSNLSPEDLDAELKKSYDAILAHIGKPPLTLAFPGNGSNAAVQAAALKYHVAFRSFQEATTDKSTVASLNGWADKLVQQKTWGVMMTHALVDGYAAMSDPEIFHAHLKYVQSRQKSIWVDTFANVSRYKLERANAKLEIHATAGGAECNLSSTLDPVVFDVPLTIVLTVPGAAEARATCDGKPLPAHAGKDEVRVEAAPGSKPIEIVWTAGPVGTRP